jgi:hypothetical protein
VKRRPRARRTFLGDALLPFAAKGNAFDRLPFGNRHDDAWHDPMKVAGGVFPSS